MPYIRIGKCKRCGKCCEGHYIIRGHNRQVLKENLIIMGLSPEIIDWIASQDFKCPYLTYKYENGRKIAVCTIYENRPKECREYPKEPADLLPGCGFSFVEVKNAKSFVQSNRIEEGEGK